MKYPLIFKEKVRSFNKLGIIESSHNLTSVRLTINEFIVEYYIL